MKGIILFFIWIILGAFIFSYLEHWSFWDAFYFAVVSVTTVGYGDLVPHTRLGKIFTTIFLLGGIGLAFYVISSFSSSIMEQYKKSSELIRKVIRKEIDLKRREKKLEEMQRILDERLKKLNAKKNYKYKKGY